MKVITDISEEDYKYAKRYSNGVCNVLSLRNVSSLIYATANGTPLPKGHGKLVDVNELKKEAIRCEWSRNMYDTLDHTLSYMKPIIEAESEKNE